jgi:hypothetical protein
MKRNGDVKLASIPPGATAILELTRVDRLFEAFDSTADAVNSFLQFPIKPFQQSHGHEYSTIGPGALRNGLGDDSPDSRERLPIPPATMRISGSWLRRQIAGCLVLLLTAPLAHAIPSSQQDNLSQPNGGVSSAQAPSNSAASKPNTEPSQSEALPNSPGTVRSQAVEDNQLSRGQQPSPNQQQNGTQEPLGTAAAPSVKTTGVAASRPAGAAIAPAKQRRARSILIKVGAIVGAGVAVGTIVALSSGSPSRPAGSR